MSRRFQGTNSAPAYGRDTIGFVFQQYHLIAELDLLRNVELPTVNAGVPRAIRHRRAAALLDNLGLGDRLHALPAALSGGQQQRVAIARACLMNGGELLLADEPTERSTAGRVPRCSGSCPTSPRPGTRSVPITHDPKVAATADRRIGMADGRIVSDIAPDGRRYDREARGLGVGRPAGLDCSRGRCPRGARGAPHPGLRR